MKAREMTAEVSALTWDNIAAILRNAAGEGFSAREISETLSADYGKSGQLLRLMYEAGACARVQTGLNAGTSLYFAPLGG